MRFAAWPQDAVAMSYRWIVPPPWSGCRELGVRLSVAPVVAQVLHNRGLSDPAAAKSFLNPKRTELSPPEAIPGLPQAAEIVVAAIRQRQPVVIYGDYDVDGIAGTAILWRLLRLAGAAVDVYIPHRLEEGYGLNASAVRRLAEQGKQTLVTVDCGATARAEVALARELGLQVVITDHHDLRGDVPEADALAHPGLADDEDLHRLCGAAVAFKLAWAVARILCGSGRVDASYREFLIDAMALVALGTIADVVPLVGENRILARFGLEGLRASSHPGFQALLATAGVGDETLDAHHVGFVLAPRLNAAGRMGHARLAFELLTRADADRAREIAIYLEEQNRRRQSIERKIVKQAREMVSEQRADSDARRAIVLACEGWHAGVLGIVAARLVEEFHRPAVLIAVENGQGQGSGRSVPNLHMFEALAACGQYLQAFGGHAMAGGLRMDAANVEPFAAAFVEYANRHLTAADLTGRLRLDAVVPLSDLKLETVSQLRSLGPFGLGNPRPRFQAEGVELAGEPRCVGQQQEHLQFTVRQDDCVLRAIAFRQAARRPTLLDHRRCDLAFEPVINSFGGKSSVELRVLDIRACQSMPAANAG